MQAGRYFKIVSALLELAVLDQLTNRVLGAAQDDAAVPIAIGKNGGARVQASFDEQAEW